MQTEAQTRYYRCGANLGIVDAALVVDGAVLRKQAPHARQDVVDLAHRVPLQTTNAGEW